MREQLALEETVHAAERCRAAQAAGTLHVEDALDVGYRYLSLRRHGDAYAAFVDALPLAEALEDPTVEARRLRNQALIAASCAALGSLRVKDALWLAIRALPTATDLQHMLSELGSSMLQPINHLHGRLELAAAETMTTVALYCLGAEAYIPNLFVGPEHGMLSQQISASLRFSDEGAADMIRVCWYWRAVLLGDLERIEPPWFVCKAIRERGGHFSWVADNTLSEEAMERLCDQPNGEVTGIREQSQDTLASDDTRNLGLLLSERGLPSEPTQQKDIRRLITDYNAALRRAR